MRFTAPPCVSKAKVSLARRQSRRLVYRLLHRRPVRSLLSPFLISPTPICSVGAHLFNAWWLALQAHPGVPSSINLGPRIVTFIEVNFVTGPGVTGWIMTVVLGVMVWFAMEKKRRNNFERFWYSHHL